MRVGSMCTGYGGLDMAVESVLDTGAVWVADSSQGAAAILAHHWPDVPNLGDITAVDWSTAPPVDIVTAGFPCQDVSAAGLQAGMRSGNRSGLWSHIAAAISVLKPSIVIIENVRGLLSARADSDLEPCPWCLGDDGDESALRALGCVLGDLADLGFDAVWTTVPASAVGAPHRRERVFIVAWFVPSVARGVGSSDAAGDGRDERRSEPAGIVGGPDAAVSGAAALADAEDDRHQRGGSHGDGGPDLRTVVAGLAADSDEQPRQQRRLAASGQAAGGGAFGAASRRDREPVAALLPTPRARDGKRGGKDCLEPAVLLPTPRATRGGSVTETMALLPTPTATPYGNNQSPSPNAAVRPSLDSRARLLPTPTVADADGTHATRGGDRSDELLLNGIARSADDDEGVRWGDYEPAIHRWEALTRPAPPPTEPGRNGKPRLSPAFSLSRNAQLTAIGNGVVWQQAAHALRLLLAHVPGEQSEVA